MKQTAVEWYAEQGMKLEISRLKGRISTEKMLDLLFEKLRQAKEMEKGQMDKVAGDWWNEGASYMHDGERKYKNFEQYYTETFKSE